MQSSPRHSSSSARWKIATVQFIDSEFVGAGLLNAFNTLHPEAYTLNIVWNNEPVAQYRCTQSTCTLHNIERLVDDKPLPQELACASFCGINIEEGTRLLWSNLYRAGIYPETIRCYEDIENSCQYLPGRETLGIYIDAEMRVAYLDWAQSVIKDFDHLLTFTSGQPSLAMKHNQTA